MAEHEIKRVPARDIITGQVLMEKYFGKCDMPVLFHAAAEWLAVGNNREFSTWPRYSMPDTLRCGRPPAKIKAMIL